MSSRARTRERRQEREKERKRNRQFLAVGIIAAIAVILAVLLVISNLPSDATIPEETIALYEGVPQSSNEQGFPVLGDPDAPVQVTEYSSFDCSHCATFYEESIPALVERVRAGEISFTYVPLYGTGSLRNGEGAARAAICAGEQDAFWVYHGTLFNWHVAYANQAFDGNRLEGGAAKLGLNVGEWNNCLRSERTNEILVAANGAANQLEGFSGTPTIAVNGQIVRDANGAYTNALADINAAIDAALASASLPEPTDSAASAEAAEETEIMPEATEEATE